LRSRKLAALAALVDDRRRVLLVHQSYGSRRWALPGGLLEPGESPQDAAVREVREELGVEFEPDGLVAVYTLAADGGIRFVFGGRLDGTPTAHDPAEISEVRWWDIDRLPQPLASSAPHAAVDAMDGRRGVFRVIEAAPTPAGP
jgi:ADP-ribose pyrophosphatase YjhB (NUDIX family)